MIENRTRDRVRAVAQLLGGYKNNLPRKKGKEYV